MRPRGNHWLRLLGVGLALVVASSYEKGAAQEAERAQSTDPELAALLNVIATRSTDDLVRDQSGNVVSVCLRWTNANNRALSLVSTISTLRALTIQGRGIPDEWTREGISHLRKMTNLASLRIACVGPDIALKDGVFEEICNLRRLKSLSLVSACPERSEYVALTNLQNLAELNVSYAVNFGDGELCLLTNLVNLQRLSIQYTAVSSEGTNILNRMQHLTNATVRAKRSSK